MQPTLRQLEYVVAVADALHFRRAAEAAGVSQPALSSQIKQLEQELGVQIFERDARRVMVTAAGEEIVRRARRVLDEVGALCAGAAAAAEPLSGPLHLGVIPTVAPYVLPRVLPAVRRAHPRLKLHLREDQTERLVTMLVDGKLDVLLLALGVRGTDRDGLTALPVFDEPFWLAAHADHPLARRDRVREHELAGQDVLLLEDGHCLREQALSVCKAAGAHESADVRGTSLPTLSQMVASNLGVTLLPECAVEAETAHTGEIVVRPFADPPPARTIGLLYRSTTARDSELRLLRDTIRSALPTR